MFEFITKHFKKQHTGHVLTEEDTKKSIEIRQLNAKINMLNRQLVTQRKLEFLEDQIINGGSKRKGSFEDQLVMQVLPLILGGAQKPAFNVPAPTQAWNQPQNTIQEPNGPNSYEVDVTDDQIREIINTNPKLIKHAKMFNDDQIKNYIKGQIPNISDNSTTKIIQAVRTA